MSPLVRERAGQILDSLPIGQEFDWVDLVSKELTAMTLATLFDFPFEQRAQAALVVGYDHEPAGSRAGGKLAAEGAAMVECFSAFNELWNQRVNAEPGNDLISMLAHNPATRTCHGDLSRQCRAADRGRQHTTRNTISGSVFALNKNRTSTPSFAPIRAWSCR